MALRHEVLDRIGGFRALADHLADDYVLGKLVAARGYRIVLSRYVVETVVAEPSLGSLWQHELRWARTVRSVRPRGYSLSFVTYTSDRAPEPLELTLRPRRWGHPGRRGRAPARSARGDAAGTGRAHRPGLAGADPGRPVLGVWGASFFGQTVRWRGREIVVGRDGHLDRRKSRNRPVIP